MILDFGANDKIGLQAGYRGRECRPLANLTWRREIGAALGPVRTAPPRTGSPVSADGRP